MKSRIVRFVKRAFRFGLKLSAVLLVAGTVVWVVCTVVLWNQAADLREEFRAKGYAMSLAEIEPPQVPDRENAAIDLLKAHRIKVKPRTKPNWEDAVGVLEYGTAAERKDPTVGKLARTFLVDYAERLALVHQAARKPKMRLPIDYHGSYGDPVYTSMVDAENMVRLLESEALIAAYMNDSKRSIEAMKAMCQLVSLMRQEPTEAVAFCQRRCANRTVSAFANVMNLTKLDQAELNIIRVHLDQVEQQALRPIKEWKSLDTMIREELSTASSYKGRRELEFFYGAQLLGPPRTWVNLVYDLAYVLYPTPIGIPIRLTDEMTIRKRVIQQLEAASRPIYMRSDMKPYVRSMSGDDTGMPQLDVYCVSYYNWFTLTEKAISRETMRTKMRGEDIAAMLEAYRLKHGAYPGRLWELSTLGLGAAPPDPFSGKPFHYRKKEGRYLLWSVGPNLVDDGGIAVNKSSRQEVDILWNTGSPETGINYGYTHPPLVPRPEFSPGPHPPLPVSRPD